MDEMFKDQVAPGRWMWCIIDNLPLFDDKSDYLLKLMEKMKQAKDHPLISSFGNIWETVENYYHENSRFPDVDWLRLNFRNIRTIVQDDTKFSMQIYDSLVKYVYQEVLRIKINKRIVEAENPSVEVFKDLAKEMQVFACKKEDIFNLPTDEDIIDSYRDDSSNVIQTGINSIDNEITSLDQRAVNVIACPSGHGKTVLTLNITYNNIKLGKKVVYVSFELSYDKLYNCLTSIHSFFEEEKIKVSSMNKGKLNEQEKELRKKYLQEVLKMPITVIDTSAMERVTKFDELLRALETSNKTNDADLIIFDNVDGFVRFCKNSGNVMNEVNNMVSKLEKFAQSFNKKGTTVLLLSQTNRKGIDDLYKAVTNPSKNVDYTCISMYSDVYQKARTVLVGYSDAKDKKAGLMHLYLVKSTFSAPSSDEIKAGVNFDYVKTLNDAKFKPFSPFDDEEEAL